MTGIASKSQLRMSFLRYALFTVPAVLMFGTLSGALAGSGYGNPWFDALEKPAAMPPGAAFGIVWPVLYILLGLSLAMVLHARGARGRGLAVGLFVLQLVLNYAWSPLFFAWHQVGAALWLIAAIIVLTVVTTVLFWGIRRAAALLLIPYLAWLAFAAFLTAEVGRLNPGAEQLVPGEVSSDIAL
jgi:tryptophan-rich sensory protein